MSSIRQKLESLRTSYQREAVYAEEMRYRDGGTTVRYWWGRAKDVQDILDMLDTTPPKPFEFKGATYIRLADRSIVRLQAKPQSR